MIMKNSFGTETSLNVAGKTHHYYSLKLLEKKLPQIARLPFSLKVLLENLLRTEDGLSVNAADIEALAKWDAKSTPSKEISFTPARVLLQDSVLYKVQWVCSVMKAKNLKECC